MSYLSRDRSGAEMFLPLLSDWDLDLAFVSAAKPYLQLKMDVKPSEDSKSASVKWKYAQLYWAFSSSKDITSVFSDGYL